MKILPRTAMAGALLAVAGVVLVICSDLFIRAQGIDGKYGLNAQANDLTGTFLVIVGLLGFGSGLRTERLKRDPVVTRRLKFGHTGGDTQAAAEQAFAHLSTVVGTFMGKIHLTVADAETGFEAKLTGRDSDVNHALSSMVTWLYQEHGTPTEIEVL